ncbi:LegC family aminotransferase [Hydrogenimonas sp.]
MRHEEIVRFIRSLYGEEGFIPLHEPVFMGNEKRYLNECVDSTFVSSVGAFVDRFEKMVADYTGAKYAVATVNGTAALHIALKLAGVDEESEVITQPLTFVATCNAISYCGARPLFVDIDRDTMGLSPVKLQEFLKKEAVVKEEGCFNRQTGRRIAAVVPMHTFGHPCRIEEIARVCEAYRIPLVEDAAESLGSFVGDRHTGTFGRVAAFSFNGNKTITTGGGGMLITDDEILARRAKHVTTTAKVPHPYRYDHDEIGYNYRLPNLNAALGCAQMEKLDEILADKRRTAEAYARFFEKGGPNFFLAREGTRANYWLNALVLENGEERDRFLEETNRSGVMTRPVWTLMNRLPMFAEAPRGDLSEAEWLEERVVNIPSGYRGKR